MVADAGLDVAVFTGHDSDQCIKQRYGFGLVTPTGVSPNEEVSNSHIVDLVELIETNGIETMLYDPFEAAQPGEDPAVDGDVVRGQRHRTGRTAQPALGGHTGVGRERVGLRRTERAGRCPVAEAALDPSWAVRGRSPFSRFSASS